MAHDRRDSGNPHCDGGRCCPAGGMVVLEARVAPDDTGAVDDGIRGIVARNWPHLLSKLPPEED